MDIDGNEIIPCIYDSLEEWNIDGEMVLEAEKNGEIIYMNEKGERVYK